jgi:hypothetical protein
MIHEIYGEFPPRSTKIENPHIEYPLYGLVLEYLGSLSDGRITFLSHRYGVEIETTNGEHSLLFFDKEFEKSLIQIRILLGVIIFWRNKPFHRANWTEALDDLLPYCSRK